MLLNCCSRTTGAVFPPTVSLMEDDRVTVNLREVMKYFLLVDR